MILVCAIQELKLGIGCSYKNLPEKKRKNPKFLNLIPNDQITYYKKTPNGYQILLKDQPLSNAKDQRERFNAQLIDDLKSQPKGKKYQPLPFYNVKTDQEGTNNSTLYVSKPFEENKYRLPVFKIIPIEKITTGIENTEDFNDKYIAFNEVYNPNDNKFTFVYFKKGDHDDEIDSNLTNYFSGYGKDPSKIRYEETTWDKFDILKKQYAIYYLTQYGTIPFNYNTDTIKYILDDIHITNHPDDWKDECWPEHQAFSFLFSIMYMYNTADRVIEYENKEKRMESFSFGLSIDGHWNWMNDKSYHNLWDSYIKLSIWKYQIIGINTGIMCMMNARYILEALINYKTYLFDSYDIMRVLHFGLCFRIGAIHIYIGFNPFDKSIICSVILYSTLAEKKSPIQETTNIMPL